MRLNDLLRNLEALKQKGFIETSRRGPTGIGHLVERELGLRESNLSIPDIGGRVEIKATRRNANSLITLFTFNRGVWRMRHKDIISKYGYVDDRGRHALYNVVKTRPPNAQGFYLVADVSKNIVVLKNIRQTTPIAEWSTYVIAGKFMTKLDRLILIVADSKVEGGKEFFYFDEVHLLEQPTPEKFLEAFEKDKLMIDIRMHMKSSGGVRNHGTAFRISEANLIDLYNKKKRLI